MRIEDTAAIVSGGASGLGEATVRLFRERGADVAILDRDAKRGARLAERTGAAFAETDVTDEDSVRAAMDAALAAMGRITCAVNCAGIAAGQSTLGKDGPHRLADFRQVIDVNLTGTFNVCRLAAEAMARNAPGADGERGVVINTASIAAFDGQRGQAAYAASKSGVAGLSLPMARDLARSGIRAMAIAPGLFDTPMLQGLPEKVREGLAADVPFPQRLGDPAEYAALALFIVESRYLNGGVIRLDGALRMP